MTSPAQPQWRFALLFLIVIGPIFMWPLALQNTVPQALSIWLFWAPLISIHGLVPFLDSLMPQDSHAALPGDTPLFNRLLPILCAPLWYATLFASAYCLNQIVNSAQPLDLPHLGMAIGLILSVGAIGGILAINPAHELIHRASTFERNLGGLLLAGVGYGAFKIEHVRGHHLHVGTERDTASARKGESVFSFAINSFFGTLKSANHIERERLERLGAKTLTWHWLKTNEVVRWNLVSASTLLILTHFFGWSAAVLFALVSLIAIGELEIINFIEHYGLRRNKTGNRYEPVKEHHSWNANSRASNAFLFNLQRHSDHHAHPGKDYLHLSSVPNAPQLPFGYGLMFLIALVPPLWRRVMDHRVPSSV